MHTGQPAGTLLTRGDGAREQAGSQKWEVAGKLPVLLVAPIQITWATRRLPTDAAAGSKAFPAIKHKADGTKGTICLLQRVHGAAAAALLRLTVLAWSTRSRRSQPVDSQLACARRTGVRRAPLANAGPLMLPPPSVPRLAAMAPESKEDASPRKAEGQARPLRKSRSQKHHAWQSAPGAKAGRPPEQSRPARPPAPPPAAPARQRPG